MNQFDSKFTWLFCLLLATFLLIGCTSSETPLQTILPKATQTEPPEQIQLTTTATSEPPTLPSNPITSGPFKVVAHLDEYTTNQVESFVSTAEGSLWLVTKHEILKLVENELTVYLSDYSGKFVGVDDFLRVWVVSEDTKQISTWDGKTWTVYTAESGWTALDENSYQQVYTGVSDGEGGFWLPTSQDVRYFDGTQWRIITRRELNMEPPVYDDLMPRFTVKTSENGVVWVGECDWGGPGPFGGGGLRWLEKGAWQGDSSPVASGCVNAIIEDSRGRTWAGVDSHLWRFDPASGGWQEFETPESPVEDMRVGFVDSFSIGPKDEIWPVLVLCGGASCYGNSVLYRIQEEKWIQVGDVAEYDAEYWRPVFDDSGTAWIFWEGGIYSVDEGTPELVSAVSGRFGVLDKNGRLWFVASDDKREALWVKENDL